MPRPAQDGHFSRFTMSPSAPATAAPPSSASAAAAGRADWRVLAGLVLLPTLVRAALGLPWVVLQNFTDGVFYSGYALHFRELIHLLGLHYYAVRFGAIFPDAVAFTLWGLPAGFVLARALLSGACCALLYLVFANRGSAAAGLGAALLWSITPAAIRLQQTGYVDSAGTHLLLLGALLLLRPRSGLAASIAGGACLALAASAHLHAAMALVFLMPLLVAETVGGGWKAALLRAAGGVSGAALATGAGVLFYYANYGLFDLTEPTREIMRALADGSVASPRLPWWEVVTQGTFWFAPLTCLGLVLAAARRSLFAWLAWTALAGYIGMLAATDVFWGGYSLSLFYYFSFALPALVLCLGGVLEGLAGNLRWKMPMATVAAFAVPVVSAVWWNENPGLWVVGSVAGAVALWVVATERTKQNLAALLGATATALVLSAAPSQRLALGHYWNGDDFALLQLAEKLQSLVPTSAGTGGYTAFWYDDAMPSDLRMLQSLHLHDFSKLRGAGGRILPPGRMRPEDAAAIRARGVQRVVLLGQDPDALEINRTALARSGLAWEFGPVTELQQGHRRVLGQSAVRPEEQLTQPRVLALDFRSRHRAELHPVRAGMVVLTSRRKHDHAAWLALPAMAPGEGVAVDVMVEEGFVELQLAPSPDGDQTTAARMLPPARNRYEVVLVPENPAEALYLRLGNAAPDGVRSRARVSAVRVGKLSTP